MKLTIVAGARPNFVKIAPLMRALSQYNEVFNTRLVHTGQHYDKNMSSSFFQELNIPNPDINLEVGSGTHAEQTANIMIKFERELLENRPDLVIVVGDVNSTLACAITAKKLGIKVAHVEAGIRSGDILMPEEINRLVTDSITDYFFTTTVQASEQLKREGHSEKDIYFVGNIMIDTLLYSMQNLKKPDVFSEIGDHSYLTITLHRPSNVDNPEKLEEILNAIADSSKGLLKVFPVHPRTRKILERVNIKSEEFLFIDPLSYLNFIYLVKNSTGIVTDSGGITEEATVLFIPCLTMRNTTERPETVTIGSNYLIGSDLDLLRSKLSDIVNNNWKESGIPDLWDGKTANRIVNILLNSR